MQTMKRAGFILALLALAVILYPGGGGAPRKAEAQSNGPGYEDNRYFLSTTTVTTTISAVATANTTNGTSTSPLTVNHVIKGGWVSCGTAGTVTFYRGSTSSSANFVFSIDVVANQAQPLTADMIQKGIPFGLGNAIYAVGPAATHVGVWVRDDPK